MFPLLIDSNNKLYKSQLVQRSTDRKNSINWGAGVTYQNAYYINNIDNCALISGKLSLYVANSNTMATARLKITKPSGNEVYKDIKAFITTAWNHVTVPFQVSVVSGEQGWHHLYINNHSNCITDTDDQLWINVTISPFRTLISKINIVQSGGTLGSSMDICCSETGQYVYQAAYGYIYVSIDYGVTFSLKNTPSGEWQSISCSRDGANILVTRWTGTNLVSSNYFNTWSEVGSPWHGTGYITPNNTYSITVHWNDYQNIKFRTGPLAGQATFVGGEHMFYPKVGIASSDSGNIIYVSSGGQGSGYNLHSYMSSNSGGNWNNLNLPYGNSNGLACSSDGIIAYIVNDGGYIYKSTNTGVSWTAFTTMEIKRWKAICCSSDGQTVSVCSYGDGIYRSINGGNNWDLIDNTLGRNYKSICCTRDGTTTFVAVNFGGIFYLS